MPKRAAADEHRVQRRPERRLDAPRGVLDLAKARQHFRHARYLPSLALAPFVEHYWRVEWALPEGTSYRQETLPHPSVHLVAEPAHCEVVGVPEGRFARVLKGQGRAFGVKFRPGGFAPFCGQPVRTFTNRRVDVNALFGDDGRAYGEAVAAEGDDECAVALAERFLVARHPEADREARRAGALVEQIAGDPEIAHVDDLAAESGASTRSLQRLFSRFVGVSPKWVILRYRLHEALARIESGEKVDWTLLALDLGYFDQAHFIKHFKRLVGRTPEAYARSLAFVAKNP